MIQPKFNIGDTIYHLRISYAEKKIPCPDCLGTREWKVICPSGEEFQHCCNTCYAGWSSSSGYVRIYEDQIFIREMTVGSVRYDSNEKDNQFSYMCQETGVGSGSVYYQKDMFSTEEEAKIFGQVELERVKGQRQQRELEERARNKKRDIYKIQKKKAKAEGK